MWIDIEDELPPHGVWVVLTRKLGDPAYTGATYKFKIKGQGLSDKLRDVGYTHWRVKDDRRKRLGSRSY